MDITVFNIQKCSIHDGPGLRTLVFLKGCPLRCLWCANPESQNYKKEVADTASHCIGCNACVEECPKGCIVPDAEGRPAIDRRVCDNCGACTKVCYAHAKRMVGEEKSEEELLRIIERDKRYYDHSGGGVTFSGGEPLTHPDALYHLAKGCHELGIHTALETCGYGDFDKFSTALSYIDFMFMDIKEIDPEKHRKLTGKSNEVILANLRKITAMGKSVLLRTPVIPGYNDSEENLRGIASLAAATNGVSGVELLAYHALGVHKYEMLGRPYLLNEVETPSDEIMDTYVEMMNEILIPAGKKCIFESSKKNKMEVDA